MNIAKFLTTAFFIDQLRWLLLKAHSLYDLIESLGVSTIATFKTLSPVTIRNMLLQLAQVMKEKLVDKISKTKVLHD